MLTLKDRIEQSAQELAQKAREVTAAANQFHDEGLITASVLERVAEEIANACPYNAQVLLERSVTQSLLTQDMQEDVLIFVPKQPLPLKHIMGGVTTSQH